MITVTCKCGKTTITFPKMTAKDFPREWETECCKDATKAEDKKECCGNCKEKPLLEPEVETVTEKPKPHKKSTKKKKTKKEEKKEQK